MKNRWKNAIKVIFCVVLIALLPPFLLSQKTYPFEVGEKLVYSTWFNFVKGGQSILQIDRMEIIDGHETYHAVFQTKSSSIFDRIYKVRDTMESWIDTQTLLPLKFEKNLREGHYRKEWAVLFDFQKLVAISDNDTNILQEPVHDALSFFYFLRAESLWVGRIFKLNNYDNNKFRPYNVIVKKTERIKVPAGDFTCYVLEPYSEDGKLFKNKSQATLYVSKDSRRLPVMITNDATFGKMILKLENNP